MNKWLGYKHDNNSIRELINEYKDNPNDKVLIKAIKEADVSKVTDMRELFMSFTYFNIDISSWDTSEVKDMSYMFYGVYKFNGHIGKWDTSEVNDMSYMFYNAINFNRDVSNWDISNVTKMKSMFYRAKKFKQDLRKWKIINPNLDSKELKIDKEPTLEDMISYINNLKEKALLIKNNNRLQESKKFKKIKHIKQLINMIQSNCQIEKDMEINHE